VEQRLAVHAGDDAEALSMVAEPKARIGAEAAPSARPSERGSARGSAREGASWKARRRVGDYAGGHAWLLVLAGVVLLAASAADAKPKRRDAKTAFDRGVAAYKKHNFDAASAALARSFELERDPDTLFAWAQAQRQLANCNKAIELYGTLLGFDLPVKNRAAVEAQLAECRDLILGQRPKVTPLPDEPLAIEPEAARSPAEPRVGEHPATPPPPAATVVAAPASAPRRSWYKDPVALGLVGGGAVVAAAGGGILFSAWSLDRDSKAASSYDDAQSLADKAKSREILGEITMGVGGVLVIGGAIWIATHWSSEEHVVTGWLAPGGGGLGVSGTF
jgi:tetratricopeptide (TPR) repeat protein